MTKLKIRLARKQKYNNKPVTIDGIRFDSIKEGKRYNYLKSLEKTGQVLSFVRQKAFKLPGNIKYFCDFEVCWANGETTVEDVKGFKTQVYKIKKKIVEEIYNIKIIEF